MPWLTQEVWNGTGYDPEPIQRWVNDFPLKRVSIECLPLVLQNYYDARCHGYNIDDAIAYSMACKESTWHSGWHPAMKKRASDNGWWHTSRINKGYTRERYLRVLANSLGRDTIGVRCLPRPDQLLDPEQWISEHLNKGCRRVKEVVRLQAKYAGIMCYASEASLYEWTKNLGDLRCWHKVKRGRDLFIPGWGPFDICATGNSLLAQDRPSTVHEVQAHGYGITPYMLENVKEEPVLMEYATHWIKWWRAHSEATEDGGDVPNFSKFDEVYEAWRLGNGRQYRYEDVGNPLGLLGLIRSMDRHPTAVIREYGEFSTAERARYNATEYKAPVIDDSWPWVESAIQPMVTKVGTLQPISTRADLHAVGERLHNCAGGYALHVQKQEYAMVKLVDASGKPIALGQYDSKGNLVQCKATCNREPAMKVKQVFEKYKPKWQK